MFWRPVIQMLWLIGAVPAVPAAVWLLISTVTLSGTAVASGLLVVFASLPLHFAFKKRIPLIAVISVSAGVALMAFAWFCAPRMPRESPGFGPVSEYAGTVRYRSWVPSSIVPEIDQHLMGARLFTLTDPMIDLRLGRRIADLNRTIYAEMARDPGFRSLPSALSECYAEVMNGRVPTGHRFMYVPESGPDRLPVILFLHGSMGNFQGYLWVWKRLADAHCYAIVAPSHGIGEWRDGDGLEEIQTALDRIRSDPRFDSNRVFLAGLSNGGAGVTFAAPQLKDLIRGRIYMSPVIDPEVIAAPGYDAVAGSSPTLVITGADDNRTDAKYVAEGVKALRETGAPVDFHLIPGEDHFLLFSQPATVMELIGRWLEKLGPGT